MKLATRYLNLIYVGSLNQVEADNVYKKQIIGPKFKDTELEHNYRVFNDGSILDLKDGVTYEDVTTVRPTVAGCFSFAVHYLGLRDSIATFVDLILDTVRLEELNECAIKFNDESIVALQVNKETKELLIEYKGVTVDR